MQAIEVQIRNMRESLTEMKTSMENLSTSVVSVRDWQLENHELPEKVCDLEKRHNKMELGVFKGLIVVGIIVAVVSFFGSVFSQDIRNVIVHGGDKVSEIKTSMR